jgi:predicted transglutaminase-like cysteine proteinase
MTVCCDYSWFTSAVRNPASDLFSIINGTEVAKTGDVFNVIQSLNESTYKTKDDVVQDPNVNFWFQYPNNLLATFAAKIVGDADSDDEKMERIQEWVVNNIEYQEDKDQYGYEELWVPPIMLLQTRKGDCEDGAFLIMGLALNAGVDPNRLRFYGGSVKAGEGAATGGHGWVAYKRESDNEWVVADFSYYPDLRPMDNRIPMKDDTRYIEQWFMFEVGEMITSDVNRVRQPDITYDRNGYYTQPNVLLPSTYVNYYV